MTDKLSTQALAAMMSFGHEEITVTPHLYGAGADRHFMAQSRIAKICSL